MTSFKLQISNLRKIRAVGVELFHAEGRMDRHDEANSCFSQFWGKRVQPDFYVLNSVAWTLCPVRSSMMTEAATCAICIQNLQIYSATLSILSSFFFLSQFYSVLPIKYQDSILLYR